MKVGEFCNRIGVPYRHARYALEKGILPAGVAAEPGRGEHRDLDFAQAFWLGIVLKLKQNGVQTPLAGEIATLVRLGVQGIARNLGWEPGFDPFTGRFDTGHRWYLDVCDMTYVRMATDANPSGRGQLKEFPWVRIDNQKEEPAAAPVIIIRLDINALAKMLRA